MNFKIGKKYIIDVTEKGIIPLMEFDRDRWFDKECDDLDFLTDEEKIIVVNEVLDKIRDEIEQHIDKEKLNFGGQFDSGLNLALKIVDKYKSESEDREC